MKPPSVPAPIEEKIDNIIKECREDYESRDYDDFVEFDEGYGEVCTYKRGTKKWKNAIAVQGSGKWFDHLTNEREGSWYPLTYMQVIERQVTEIIREYLAEGLSCDQCDDLFEDYEEEIGAIIEAELYDLRHEG
jgi:hypothetical protein